MEEKRLKINNEDSEETKKEKLKQLMGKKKKIRRYCQKKLHKKRKKLAKKFKT